MDVMVFRSAKEQAALALGRHAWLVRGAYGFWRFFQAKYTMGAAGVVIEMMVVSYWLNMPSIPNTP